jgi:hypothetical protein
MNEWRLEDDYAMNAKRNWYFDGSNVLRSIEITKPVQLPTVKASTGQLLQVPFSEATKQVAIEILPSQGHPLADIGVNIPWLAFCSGAYLKRPGRPVPLPTSVIRLATDSFGYSDAVETFGDELGLPRKLELFTSGNRAQAVPGDIPFDHGQQLARAIATVPSGILRFRYVVEESTNFLGWNIPTKFHWIEYKPDSVGDTDEIGSGDGRLISIRESPKPNNVFVPGRKHTIVDYRFRSETRLLDSIHYTATNIMSAPPVNDKVLQQVFARELAQSPVRNSNVLLVRRGVTLTVLLLLLILLFFVVKKTFWRRGTSSIELNQITKN